jgi:hypothetical protein
MSSRRGDECAGDDPFGKPPRISSRSSVSYKESSENASTSALSKRRKRKNKTPFYVDTVKKNIFWFQLELILYSTSTVLQFVVTYITVI